MNNFKVEGKIVNQKSSEAIIKNYVLGCILECAIRKDRNIILNIERFLVYESKIISLDTFLKCIQKVKLNRRLGIKESNQSYIDLKRSINIINYTPSMQNKIIEKLQEYATNYDGGIYIHSKMSETDFTDVTIG